ncbi:MAG: hypothetical protein WBM62_11295, partial [Crocosphaera sp.]
MKRIYYTNFSNQLYQKSKNVIILLATILLVLCQSSIFPLYGLENTEKSPGFPVVFDHNTLLR